jgi:hypothetical protein
MKLTQYDVVKVTQIRRRDAFRPAPFNRRAPQIGDIATILEVYTKPPGYELECSDEHGITEWLDGFKADDIELELVRQ